MSNEQIKIGLVVSSNGTTQAEIKDAEKLASVYERASKAAASIGGTSGSRAMAAKAAPTGSQALIDDKQYNQLRGAAGVTGASARDFAAQAQGLGGLVRAYATFAANIFAVSAAFSALKNAADTTNLVKGLDTLGAASGRSLGSLSKRLVEVTDGAISLREAMTATAQASSAGMTNANIERLTLVAKNASLALGISMPDALSRLSRGITKLEPELLDELGIFTKIGPATEEYARQIGKSASQLTDFERRQAFANAVIKEGEEKFSALNAAAANPYDKLLSTVKNAGNSILSILNTLITPLINFLSNNPVVVIAGLIASAGALIKRALPDVFASFDRTAAANMKALEGSRARIAAINAEIAALDAQKKADEAAAQAATRAADARLNATDRAEAAAAAVRGEKGRARKLDDILGSVGYEDITKSQLAELRKEALSAKNKKAAKGYEDLANSIEEYQQALVKETAAIERSAASKQKLAAAEAKVKQDTKELIALTQQAALSTARKNAMDMVQQQGILKVGTAIKDLNTDLKALDVGKTERLSEIFKFIGGTLSGGFDKILGIFNKISIYVTAIIAAWEFLDGLFSTNKAQVDKLNSSLTALEENARTVTATIATTYDKSGAAISSIKSVNALSTAMNELNDSTNAVQASFKAVQKSSSGWDKFWDSIFDLAGFGIDTKLAKSMATSIKSSFQLLSRAGLGSDFETSVKSILKVDNLVDESQLAAAYKRLTDEQKKAIDKLREDANRQLGNTASALQNFKDRTDEATKLYKDFVNSYRDTSPLFKLGEALVEVGFSIQKIIDADPKRLSEAFDDLVKNSDKVVLFGDVFIKTFTSIGQAINVAVKNTEAVTEAIRQYSVVQKDLQKSGGGMAQAQQAMAIEQGFSARSFPTVNFAGTNTGTYVQGAKQVGEFGPDFIREFKRELSRNADVVNKGNDALIAAQKQAMDKGLELIGASVAQAVRQGNIEVARTIVSNFTGTRRAEADTTLAKQELQIQIDAIMMAKKMAEVQFSLVDQTKIANALQEEANELLRLSNLQNADKKDAKAIDAQKEKVQAAQINTAKQKFAMGGQGALTQEELARIDPKELANLTAQRSKQLAVFNQGFNAPLATLAAKGRSIGIAGEFGRIKGESEDAQKSLESQEKINAALQNRIALLDSINGGQNEGVILARLQLDREALALRQKREISTIQEKILLDEKALAEAEKQRRQAPKTATKEEIDNLDKIVNAAKEELRLSKERKATVIETQSIETDTAALKQQVDLNKIAVNRIDIEQKAYENQNNLDKTRLDTELQLKQIKLDTEQGVQAAQLKNLQLSDSQKATIEYQSTLRQATLELESKKIQANAELARKEALFTFQFNKALAADTGDGEGGLSADTIKKLKDLNATRQQDIASAKSAVQIAEEQYNKTVMVAGAVKDAALRQDEWNQKLQLAADIAGSLRGAFEGATGALGQFGQNLGSVVEALSQVTNLNKQNSDNLKNNAKEQTDVNSKLSAYYDVMDSGGQLSEEQQKKFTELSGRKIELLDEETSIKKKSERDELAGNTKLVGSVKNLFGQKTGAYKALAAVEKAMHLARLAMDVKEMVSKIFTTQVSTGAVAAGQAQQTAATESGVLSRLSGYAAEIYGKTIGQLGPIAGPIVATALVAAMFAMMGKSGKKSGGFMPTYAQAQEVQGTAMDYNSKGEKVQVRTGVLGDTSAKSQSIENSLKIIKENSVDGLSYDNKVVQLLESIDKGINKTALRAYNLPGVASGTAFGTVEGTKKGSGFLGTGLFATKLSTSIINSGLEISGTFLDLAKATEKDLIKVFEVVQKSKRVWVGLKGWQTSTWSEVLTTSVKEIDMGLVEAFQGIFSNARDTMVEVGKLVGVGVKSIDDALSTMSLTNKFVSLRGLKGDELATQLNAVISSALDDAVEGIFQTFKQYQKFGEGLLETIVRITDSNAKVNQALKNIGAGQGRVLDIAATEAFLDVAGGIDTFVEKYNKFSSNFLTEAERIKPKTLAVAQFITDLGFESVDTKEEFLGLVRSLDLSTDAGQKTFDSLMKVSEAFSEVTDYLDRLKETATGFSVQILKLTGRDAEALAMERQATLDKTDELFKPTQRYIFALEDVKTAQDNLTKARDREKSSLSSQKNALTSFLTNIKNFTDGLLLGSQSILTPLQKYTQAKDKFQELLTAASAIPSTEAEIKARDDAANQLTSAASAYLDASRAYNASSEAYTQDFNLVQEKLSGLSSVMTDQLATIDDQVNALTDNTTALQTVAEATQALATAMANEAIAKAAYTSSQSAVSAATSMPTTENKIKRAVSDIYQSAFGRAPDTGGLNYWTGVAAKDYYDAASQQVNSAALAQQIWGSSSPDDKVRAAYWKVLGRKESEIDAGGFQYWTNRIASGSISMQDFYAAVAGGATGTDVAKAEAWKRNPVYYARGGYASSGWAMVGEQGPELVDFQSPGRVYTAQQTQSAFAGATANMAELVQEVKRLNQEVQRLQQVVADGSMMNVQATERNTQEITQSVKSAETSQIHVQQISRKVAVV